MYSTVGPRMNKPNKINNDYFPCRKGMVHSIYYSHLNHIHPISPVISTYARQKCTILSDSTLTFFLTLPYKSRKRCIFEKIKSLVVKRNILLTFLTILVLLNSAAIGYYVYHDQKEHEENEEPPFHLMKSSDVDFPTTFSLAGEQVPLERIDVAEAFKKELIVISVLWKMCSFFVSPTYSYGLGMDCQ